jgi:hypothetical protein
MTFQWGDTPPLGDEDSTLVPLGTAQAEMISLGDDAASDSGVLADVDADFDAEV